MTEIKHQNTLNPNDPKLLEVLEIKPGVDGLNPGSVKAIDESNFQGLETNRHRVQRPQGLGANESGSTTALAEEETNKERPL
jgi:hypothetical protein